MGITKFLLGCVGLCSLTYSSFASASQSSLPFLFVPNAGQAAPEVRFIGNGPQFKAWFFDTGVTLQRGESSVRLRFQGGNPKPEVDGSDSSGSQANFVHGSDPRNWQLGLPMLRAIHYRDVWPGVEVRFKALGGEAKAEYVVAPGASVDSIRLEFDGDAFIEEDGSLVVYGQSGVFRENKPFLFQIVQGKTVEVAGKFRRISARTVGFEAASYDRSESLVVDPTILFSGYFGGLSQSNITGVAVNSIYNTIVTGWTIGTDLPTSGGAKATNAGGVDAFVAGFSPDGGRLLFCTYLGGKGDDRASGIAIDQSNNIYVTGYTASSDFPAVNAIQNKLKGVRDAFVVKLDATASSILYSTYLGGTGVDTGNGITVDPTGGAVVIGDTTSSGIATTGAFQTAFGGSQDAFIARLSANGAAVSWLTYFGGSGSDHGAAIRVDATGALIFGGGTYSTNLPTLLAPQPIKGQGQDGFVARITGDGRSLLLSSYIGASGGTASAPETVNTVAVSPSGFILAGGVTSSPDFHVLPGAMQTVYGGGNTDGFVVHINPQNGKMTAASFVGGSGDDSVLAMSADSGAMIYLTGYTSSADFPTRRSLASPGGSMDAFVVKMTFTRLIFSTYLGGNGSDCGNALAIDSLTNIIVGGSTSSSNFPVKAAGLPNQTGSISSFLTKIAPGFALAVANEPIIYVDEWRNTGYNGSVVTLKSTSFGQAGDIPLVGDWTGSGLKRLGVFRNGVWILDANGNGVIDAADPVITFGQAGDIPIIGDWNGTGKIKLGLFRNGVFILDFSGHLSGVPTGLQDRVFPFGQAGDTPVTGDWDASGRDKIGIFRNGVWQVDYNGDYVFDSLDRTYLYGTAGDRPVVGDWTGAGVVNQLGVYNSGHWTLNVAGNNVVAGTGQYELYLGFGGAAFRPLVI